MTAQPNALALRTDDGSFVRIGRLLGSGGEARIHEVIGASTLVAKLYHDDDPAHRSTLLREKEGKILAMLARPPEISSKNSAIAWPASALRQNGKFVGFLMPRAQGTILFRYHNPKERRKHSPNFDWLYLHRAAFNLAAIVDAIHRVGHVIADVNDQNFLVQDSALVAAVDTDSFQIRDAASRWHLCAVGRPEFTPPELQGKSFADHVRGPEQDRFGLAVLIFQLLMEGSHPFRARLSLPKSVPESQLYCIQHGHFPYDPAPGNPAAPPPTAFNFQALHPLLKNLFRRCFVDGHADPSRRPAAADWREVLKQAEDALITCPQGHKHSGTTAECPWCARAAKLKALPPPVHRTAPPRPPASSRPRVLPTTTTRLRPSARPSPRPVSRRMITTSPPSPVPEPARWVWGWLMIVLVGTLGRTCNNNNSPARPQFSSYSPPTTYSDYNPTPAREQAPSKFLTDTYAPGRMPGSNLPATFKGPANNPLLARAPLKFKLEQRSQVTSASFSPDGKWVVTTGQDVRIWNSESGQLTGEPIFQSAGFRAAVFSPDGTRLMTAGNDHLVRIWNLESRKQIAQPMTHYGYVTVTVFSPDGRRVLTAGTDRIAQVWDAGTGERIGNAITHERAILSAAFSPNGGRVATASADSTARVWDAATGEPVTPRLLHTASVNAIAFSPDGNSVVTASDDGSAVLWRVSTGKPIGLPMKHDGTVAVATFSPDGQWVATGGDDDLVKIWYSAKERETAGTGLQAPGQPACPPLHRQHDVTSLQFSADGKFLLTACGGRSAQIYDLKAGLDALQVESGSRIDSLVASADGRTMLSQGSGTNAHLWVWPAADSPRAK